MDGYLLNLQHLDSFQKWALICTGALTVLYIVMRPFKKGRKDPLKPQTNLSLAGQREMERQMTELLVELEQMARHMTAQLETRTQKLELLIKEADQKITLLQGVAENAPVPVNGSIFSETPPELATVAVLDSRHAQVYDLADAGQPAHQIAQHLDRPQGEIELILALRRRGTAAAASS